MPGLPAWVPAVIDLLIWLPVIGPVGDDGFLRVLITCNRLRIVWRVLLLVCWWVPVFNLYLFYRVLRAARSEYYFDLGRLEREAVHAENEDCRTKYPILLVHGIFFSATGSWSTTGDAFPQALQKCGARLYYGGQQSAAPVAVSAAELKARVEAVLAETGAEKLNLIAPFQGRAGQPLCDLASGSRTLYRFTDHDQHPASGVCIRPAPTGHAAKERARLDGASV